MIRQKSASGNANGHTERTTRPDGGTGSQRAGLGPSVDADEGEPIANDGFFVPGPPVPQPRMTRRSLYGKDEQGNPTAKSRAVSRYLTWKETVGWEAKAAGVLPVEGFVHLELEIYVPDRRKRKWDVSNIIKSTEDALNGVAYVDDKQVVGVTARLYTASRYGRGEEGVHIWVEEVS